MPWLDVRERDIKVEWLGYVRNAHLGSLINASINNHSGVPLSSLLHCEVKEGMFTE